MICLEVTAVKFKKVKIGKSSESPPNGSHRVEPISTRPTEVNVVTKRPNAGNAKPYDIGASGVKWKPWVMLFVRRNRKDDNPMRWV